MVARGGAAMIDLIWLSDAQVRDRAQNAIDK